MLERGDFLLAPRGADRDREVASGVQHPATALIAGLQAAGAGGVRAAKGGSSVAYGSLRATLCILIRRGCDVNSLTHRGTKSRSGQSARGFVVLPFLWLTALFTRHRGEPRRSLLVRSEIVRRR